VNSDAQMHSFEATSLPSQMLSSRQRVGDIISMSHMVVLGVRLIHSGMFVKADIFPYIAHRTLIVRKLKGLEGIVDFTSVHWYMDLGGIGA
jgi:hypothetical protein